MRASDLLIEKTLYPVVRQMSDQDRHGWIMFLMRWLRGDFMHKATGEELSRWQEFSRLFPHGVTHPILLYRLITIPRKYVELDHFTLQQPAPGPVGSWTSTKAGIDCVAGIARDFAEGTELQNTTARIAISAMIDPSNLYATVKSIRHAFLSLTHDWADAEYSVKEPRTGADGKTYDLWTTKFHPYLNDDSDEFHMDLGYYIGICERYTGGPYRQYEHIVHTTPVDAKKVIVYRDGAKHLRYGNDDPHN